VILTSHYCRIGYFVADQGWVKLRCFFFLNLLLPMILLLTKHYIKQDTCLPLNKYVL
jgi:hypothetical protein